MSNGNDTLKGFITGAILGAGFGLLFAPRSGDKTRERLREWSKEQSEQLQKQIDQLRRDMLNGGTDITTRIKNLSDDIERISKEALETGQQHLRDDLESLLNALEQGRQALQDVRTHSTNSSPETEPEPPYEESTDDDF